MTDTSEGHAGPGEANLTVNVSVRFDRTEVVLLAASTDVIEEREGGNPSVVRKVPGRIHFGTLMLLGGTTASAELCTWWKTVLDGQTSRLTVAAVEGRDRDPRDRARGHGSRVVFQLPTMS